MSNQAPDLTKSVSFTNKILVILSQYTDIVNYNLTIFKYDRIRDIFLNARKVI
jgi:hypothetical protein